MHDAAHATLEQADILQMLSFYNVRYVTLYQDYAFGGYGENTERLKPYFGEPLEVEWGTTFFRVEQRPQSRNIVFPGLGFQALKQDDPQQPPIREVCLKSDLHVLNATQAKTLQMRFDGQSVSRPRDTLHVSINDAPLATVVITQDWTPENLPDIPLKPGINTLHIAIEHENWYDHWREGIRIRNIELQFFNE